MGKEPSLGSGKTWSPSDCPPPRLDFRAEETAVSEPKACRGWGGGWSPCAHRVLLPLAAAIHD